MIVEGRNNISHGMIAKSKKQRIRVKPNKIKNIGMDTNFSIYAFICIVYLVGVVLGSMFFRIAFHDVSIRNNIIEKYAIIDNLSEDDYQYAMEYSIFQNIKTVIIFWVGGISVVGSPFLVLLLFYKGFINSFLIATIFMKLGFWNGMVFVLKRVLSGMLFEILAIVVLIASSIHVAIHVLRQRKDMNYEIIRHSMISILAIFLLMISSFLKP